MSHQTTEATLNNLNRVIAKLLFKLDTSQLTYRQNRAVLVIWRLRSRLTQPRSHSEVRVKLVEIKRSNNASKVTIINHLEEIVSTLLCDVTPHDVGHHSFSQRPILSSSKQYLSSWYLYWSLFSQVFTQGIYNVSLCHLQWVLRVSNFQAPPFLTMCLRKFNYLFLILCTRVLFIHILMSQKYIVSVIKSAFNSVGVVKTATLLLQIWPW